MHSKKEIEKAALICRKIFETLHIHFSVLYGDEEWFNTDGAGFLANDPRYQRLRSLTSPPAEERLFASWQTNHPDIFVMTERSDPYFHYTILYDVTTRLRILAGPVSYLYVERSVYMDYCAAHRISQEAFYMPAVITDETLSAALSLIYAVVGSRNLQLNPSLSNERVSRRDPMADAEFPIELVTQNIPSFTEEQFFKPVEEGNLEAAVHAGRTDSIRLRQLATTPLKNFEYMCVAMIILSSRAAIRGGMDPEKAYVMSNRYLRSLSAAATVQQMSELNERCYKEYILAVHQAKQSQNAAAPPYLRTAKNYISRSLNLPLTTDLVAAHCGISASRLSHVFTAYSGMSVMKYITDARLEAAAEMLSYSAYPIAQIAEHYHFSSPSRFAMLFKEKYHCTPKKYRARMNHP